MVGAAVITETHTGCNVAEGVVPAGPEQDTQLKAASEGQDGLWPPHMVGVSLHGQQQP